MVCTVTVVDSAATRPSATDTIRSAVVTLERPDRGDLDVDVGVVVGLGQARLVVDLAVAHHHAVDHVVPEEAGEELVAHLFAVGEVHRVVDVREPVEVAPADLDAFDEAHGA